MVLALLSSIVSIAASVAIAYALFGATGSTVSDDDVWAVIEADPARIAAAVQDELDPSPSDAQAAAEDAASTAEGAASTAEDAASAAEEAGSTSDQSVSDLEDVTSDVEQVSSNLSDLCSTLESADALSDELITCP